MIRKIKLLVLIIALSVGASLVPLTINSNPGPADIKISIQKSYAFKLGDTTIVTKTLAGKDASSSPWVKKLYNTCRMFLDIVAFLLLIFIAFMNILQKDIETYAIKKMLPPAIYALILGNLGLPIFALISRMIDALMGIHMFSPLNLTQIYAIIVGGDLVGGGLLITVLAVVAALSFWNCFGWCFFFIILGVPLIGVIILNLLLSLRPMVIYLAAAISPIAFAANILPGTQPYFKRWLGIIMPWMIFPPLVAFMFYVAGLLPANTAVNVNWTDGFVTKVISIVLPILMKAGILYFAIRLPFTLEKDIAVLAATAGKAAANWGWGAGRNAMGLAYRKFDNAEKTAIGEAPRTKEHIDAAEKIVDDQKDASGNIINKGTIQRTNHDTDEEYEAARKSAVDQEAKANAKKKFRREHKAAELALSYNPFNALDAYKESKEMRINRGKTGAKKFSRFDQIIGGPEYMQKYKQEAAKDDLRSEQSPAAAMGYAPGSYKKIFTAVRDHADKEADKYTASDIPALQRSNEFMANYVTAKQANDEAGMEQASRMMALKQLRDMNIGGAGAPSYRDAFPELDDKSAGEMVEINNKFWQNVSRRFSKTDAEIFKNAGQIAGGLPAVITSSPGTSSPVGGIGEIADAESVAGSVMLSNEISDAVNNLGLTVAEDLPSSIAQAVEGLEVKASLPDVRATVDKFSMDAVSNMQDSGLEGKDAKLLIDAASMGNLGFVSSAIQNHATTGGDPSTNPFFLAIRRAAAAGYLQRSTENNIVQEIAKSEDTGTTLMMAQRLAPAMAQQGGEGLVNQHLKTLVDVTAGVQVEPQVKQDMQRYFENLNLGVKVGGELQIDPTRVQSALTALKSPEFQVNPKIAIGKATLSNGYAQNVQDSIKAAMANKIPDDAIAYDQTIQLRLNETIRAEANVRGVDLSKASMEAIEKAKAQIQSQIVTGNNAQMAVTQAFDVMVQSQPQIVRQDAPAPVAPQTTPAQTVPAQAKEIPVPPTTQPPTQ